MKTIKLMILVALSLGACKKASTAPPVEATKSKFSYSGFEINGGALLSAEAHSDYLTFSFTKPGMEINLPHLIVQIYNYKGPGTYGPKDGVIVYAHEKNDESYWQHLYTNDDPQVHSHAKVVIKIADEYLSAEIEGELVHHEFIGDKLIRMYTPFSGKTLERLYKP